MKSSKNQSSIPVKIIPDADAKVAFSKLAKPVGFPSLPYIYGFLTGITTTPSMIAPTDWQEVLYGDIVFDSAHQVEEIWKLLLPLTNHLLTEIHQETIRIPSEIISEEPNEAEWQNLVQWSQGFALANREFKHLWEITLENIATKLNDQALGDEMWKKLTIAWTALVSAGDAEILNMLRQSEPFNGKTEPQLHALLLAEFQANISFLAKTCERFILIQQKLRAESST